MDYGKGLEEGFKGLAKLALAGVVVILLLVGTGAYFLGKSQVSKPLTTEVAIPVDSLEQADVCTKTGDTLMIKQKAPVIIVKPGQDPQEVLDQYLVEQEGDTCGC